MRISDWSSDVCSSDLGSFRTPFDPTAINYGSDYTEGNAWQYSWFVPQDQAALFRILGGDAKAIAKLDAMFDYDNSKLDYSHAEDIAGLIGQYIHGNEPSPHEIGREACRENGCKDE